MVTLWFIGALFSLGVLSGLDKQSMKWYEFIFSIIFIIAMWPLFLGALVGILSEELNKQKG